MPDYEYDFVGQGVVDDASYEDACRAANDYSVSLISGNRLVGSGTLVSVGESYGILTADHVWDVLGRQDVSDHFCIIVGTQHQRFEYLIQDCTPIIVGKYSAAHAMEGPDLTFVRLNNLFKLETIKSRKSFYPIEASKAEMFTQIPYTRCPWLVWGAPGEKSWTVTTDTPQPLLGITHFVGAANFVEKFDLGGFDYVKIRISSGEHDYPISYGGVSGGGVWVPFRFSKDPLGRVLDPMVNLLLCGVAYYQSEEEPNYKLLTLHGPKSIYEKLISRVREAV